MPNFNPDNGQFIPFKQALALVRTPEKFQKVSDIIDKMPKTYEQDGLGDNAIVSLHYHTLDHQCHWFITEKDMEAQQYQAFGLVKLGNFEAELGYINLLEVCQLPQVIIDLEFEPKPLGECKAKYLSEADPV